MTLFPIQWHQEVPVCRRQDASFLSVPFPMQEPSYSSKADLPGKACHSCSVCRMARGIVHIILWRICGIVPDAQIHISGGTESEILEKTDFSVYVAECPPSIIFRCSLVQFHDCHRVRHIVLYVRRRMEQRTRILRIIVFSRCIRHIRRHSKNCPPVYRQMQEYP